MKTFALSCLALVLIGAGSGYAQNGPAEMSPRARVLAWLRANWAGDSSRVVQDMSNMIDQAEQQQRNYSMVFGEDLIQAGQPYMLEGFCGQFFAFALTPQQARALNIKATGGRFSEGSRSNWRRQALPSARLESVNLDNGTDQPGDQAVGGKVRVKLHQGLPANVALRLTYSVGGSTISKFIYPDQVPNDGVLRFSFKPILEDGKQFRGPMVLFFDLCTVTQNGGNLRVDLLSNTKAVLVDVQ